MGECILNFNLMNIIQLVLIVICLTSIFSFSVHSYGKFKHKVEEKIINNMLLQWLGFIKTLSPKAYIIYEKYEIWRYSERFKMKMMF